MRGLKRLSLGFRYFAPHKHQGTLRAMVLSFLSVMALPALGGDQASAYIAVVNLDRVAEPVMAELRQQVEGVLKQYHQEFLGYEEKLRQENQQLIDDQKALAPDDTEGHEALQKRKQAFEVEVLSVQRKAEERREKLSAQHAAVSERFRALLVEIIRGVRLQKNIALVVPQSQVLDFDEALDITPDVETHLRERKLDLSFDLPGDHK